MSSKGEEPLPPPPPPLAGGSSISSKSSSARKYEAKNLCLLAFAESCGEKRKEELVVEVEDFGEVMDLLPRAPPFVDCGLVLCFSNFRLIKASSWRLAMRVN